MVDVVAADTSIDVRCSSGYEFLHLLDPLEGLFHSSTYIFRGVSSKQHELLPSAHREGVRLLTPNNVAVYGPLDTLRKQCGAEFYTIDRFFRIVSRHGIRMPEDTYVLREELDRWSVRFQQNTAEPYADAVWPSPQLYSLIALAQHHGVPTRALDWTYDAFVAAYFAARAALDADSGCIAVWALDDLHRQVERVIDGKSSRSLQVFTVSGAENANLRAQRGLFMLHPQLLTDPWKPFGPRRYDFLLRESLPLTQRSIQFIRILLDVSLAKEVLSLLAVAGVTRGALHPGLAGAAEEFKDEQLFPQARVSAGGHTREMVGIWDRIHEAINKPSA